MVGVEELFTIDRSAPAVYCSAGADIRAPVQIVQLLNDTIDFCLQSAFGIAHAAAKRLDIAQGSLVNLGAFGGAGKLQTHLYVKVGRPDEIADITAQRLRFEKYRAEPEILPAFRDMISGGVHSAQILLQQLTFRSILGGFQRFAQRRLQSLQ